MNAILTDDSRVAYLFSSVDGRMRGVTLEAGGASLPPPGPWQFIREFALGVHAPGPGIPPEPILRGILNDGYFVWNVDPKQPFGTSQ